MCPYFPVFLGRCVVEREGYELLAQLLDLHLIVSFVLGRGSFDAVNQLSDDYRADDNFFWVFLFDSG